MNRLTFGRDDLDPVTKKNQPYRDSQRRFLLAHPDFCWDNLIWGARERNRRITYSRKKEKTRQEQTNSMGESLRFGSAKH